MSDIRHELDLFRCDRCGNEFATLRCPNCGVRRSSERTDEFRPVDAIEIRRRHRRWRFRTLQFWTYECDVWTLTQTQSVCSTSDSLRETVEVFADEIERQPDGFNLSMEEWEVVWRPARRCLAIEKIGKTSESILLNGVEQAAESRAVRNFEQTYGALIQSCCGPVMDDKMFGDTALHRPAILTAFTEWRSPRSRYTPPANRLV
jgi:hypothetical protein